LGAGPRAGQFLIQGGKALAAMDARFFRGRGRRAEDRHSRAAAPHQHELPSQAEGMSNEDLIQRLIAKRRRRRFRNMRKADRISIGCAKRRPGYESGYLRRRVENGCVQLPAEAHLPEKSKGLCGCSGMESPGTIHIRSPRLADPSQAPLFKLEVREERDAEYDGQQFDRRRPGDGDVRALDCTRSVTDVAMLIDSGAMSH